jgi:DNA-directed RNA polymerase specialized sigma24 family protein
MAHPVRPPLHVVPPEEILRQQARLVELLDIRFGGVFDEETLARVVAEAWDEAEQRHDSTLGASIRTLTYQRAIWRLQSALRDARRMAPLDPPPDPDGVSWELDSGAPDPDARADARKGLERAWTVIAALPTRIRDCFVRHLRQESSAEIAAALGLSQASVEVNVSRARAEVVRALPEYAPIRPANLPRRGRPRRNDRRD